MILQMRLIMYVSMYLCMHMHVYVYRYVSTCTQIKVPVQTNTNVFITLYMSNHIASATHAYTYICMHTYTYAFTLTGMHIHMGNMVSHKHSRSCYETLEAEIVGCEAFLNSLGRRICDRRCRLASRNTACAQNPKRPLKRNPNVNALAFNDSAPSCTQKRTTSWLTARAMATSRP